MATLFGGVGVSPKTVLGVGFVLLLAAFLGGYILGVKVGSKPTETVRTEQHEDVQKLRESIRATMIEAKAKAMREAKDKQSGNENSLTFEQEMDKMLEEYDKRHGTGSRSPNPSGKP